MSMGLWRELSMLCISVSICGFSASYWKTRARVHLRQSARSYDVDVDIETIQVSLVPGKQPTQTTCNERTPTYRYRSSSAMAPSS